MIYFRPIILENLFAFMADVARSHCSRWNESYDELKCSVFNDVITLNTMLYVNKSHLSVSCYTNYVWCVIHEYDLEVPKEHFVRPHPSH